jgi:hypothetical protein
MTSSRTKESKRSPQNLTANEIYSSLLSWIKEGGATGAATATATPVTLTAIFTVSYSKCNVTTVENGLTASKLRGHQLPL